MYEIFMVVYLVLALALIGFILIQKSKGAGMGASFGAGASGTVFGSGGSGNFLTKTTTILAIGFFAIALTLGNLTSNQSPVEAGNDLFTEEDLTPKSSDIPQPDTEIPTSQSTPKLATDSEIPALEQEKVKDEAEQDKTEKDKQPQ